MCNNAIKTVTLGLDEFEALTSGEVLIVNDVRIALSDIGFDVMIEIIKKHKGRYLRLQNDIDDFLKRLE